MAESGRWEEARSILETALLDHPDDALLQYNLGYILERLGDPGRARAAYHKALDSKPSLAVASVNLAVLLVAQGDLEGAEEILRRALNYDDREGSIYYHLALVLFLRHQNVTEPARSALDRARELGYERPHLYVLLARAARVTRDYAQALRWLEKALELAPEDPLAQHEVGLTRAAMGDLEDGRLWLEKALALRPGDVELVSDLARVLLRAERADHAVELLEQELERHPDEPSLLYLLGRAQQLLGDPRAEETLRRFETLKNRPMR